MKTILQELQRFQLSDADWKKKAHEVASMISQNKSGSKHIVVYSNESNQTKFDTDFHLKDTEAILLAINAFANHNSKEPTIDELVSILARSNHPLEKSVINKRINHLKTKKQF